MEENTVGRDELETEQTQIQTHVVNFGGKMDTFALTKIVLQGEL